jgi:hypothetical protein
MSLDSAPVEAQDLRDTLRFEFDVVFVFASNFAASWNVDPYSTGSLFEGWKEREDAVVLWRLRDTYQPMVVYLARTWLLREGWRKHGLIRFDEVPSARALERNARAIA